MNISSVVETDPITFSVILNRFNGIAHEMTLALEQSAFTPILALSRDFSCAIYDDQLRQVAMYDALPIHTTSLRIVLEEIARTFEGRVNDGDVFMCNDPYRGNTHLGDVVTALPVFLEGELRFWSVTKGHQLDIGGYLPSSVIASARNVGQEGLTIPPIKIHDRGEPRDDVIDLYLSNVRYRDLLRGDLLAQLGSIEKGRERLMLLCDEYGTEVVMAYANAIIDYADRRMSEQLQQIPDGEYCATYWLDSDGIDGMNIPIEATVTITGDKATVDYTGSGPQGEGGLNGSYATSQAAGAAPFLYYVDPDIPHNEGCIQHIKVIAPEGTVCNASYPASTSCATIVPSDAMQEVVHKAMAQAAPELVMAGSARAGVVPQFTGINKSTGEPWGVMLFNGTGAQGASKNTDGWPLYCTPAAAGGLKAQSLEQLELLFPLKVKCMEVETDSMGAGESIGGAGVRLSVASPESEMVCMTHGDGCSNPPHGTLGGRPGIGGGQYVEQHENGQRRYISSSGHVRIAPEEFYVGVSTGGGGYGDPLKRDAEVVRCNVRDQFISRKTAEDIFGVVVSADFNPKLDIKATEDRRAELAQRKVKLVDPTTPATDAKGAWVHSQLREGDVFLANPVS